MFKRHFNTRGLPVLFGGCPPLACLLFFIHFLHLILSTTGSIIWVFVVIFHFVVVYLCWKGRNACSCSKYSRFLLVDCNSLIVSQIQNSVLRCWRNVFFWCCSATFPIFCSISHFITLALFCWIWHFFLVFFYAFTITIILSIVSTQCLHLFIFYITSPYYYPWGNVNIVNFVLCYSYIPILLFSNFSLCSLMKNSTQLSPVKSLKEATLTSVLKFKENL